MRILITMFFFLFTFFDSTSQVLIPFLNKNGLYGYCDVNKKLVIPCKYEKCEMFINEHYAKAERNGEKYLVLCNGMEVNNNLGDYQGAKDQVFYPINIFSDKNGKERIDTLKDILICTGDSLVFVNIKTNQRISYPYENTNRPSPLDISKCVFRNGYLVVSKKRDKANVIDTELKEVFNSDFSAIQAIQNQLFIVNNVENKFGICDKEGKMIVPYFYSYLYNYYVNEENLFLVKSDDPRKSTKSNLGLMNEKGKLVIDSNNLYIYNFSKYFWVGKSKTFDDGTFLDSEGIEIPGFKGGQITLIDSTYIKIILNGKANLYDKNLKMLLPQEITDIQILRNSDYHNYIIVSYSKNEKKETEKIIAYDKSLKLLFELSGNYQVGAWEIADGLLELKQKNTNQQENLIGIVSKTGNIIIPCKFSSITKLNNMNFFQAKKDNLFGIYDLDGKEILPCEYKAFDSKEIDSKIVFYLKHKDKNEADVFDKNFKPLTGNIKKKLLGKKSETIESENVSIAEYTENTQKRQSLETIKNLRDGKTVACENKEGLTVYYTNGNKPIIPNGFAHQKNTLDYHFIWKTGLIEVIEKSALMEITGSDGKQSYILKKDISEPDFKTGFIDFDGKWIIEPKEVYDLEFRNEQIILMKNVKNKQYTNTLFSIGKDKITTMLIEKLIQHANNYIVISKYNQFLQKQMMDIIDFDGKSILKEEYENIKIISENGYEIKAILQKSNKRYLFEYAKNSYLDIGNYNADNVNELDPNTFMVEHDGKFGLIDSLGKVIIPCEYKLIKKIENKEKYFYYSVNIDKIATIFNEKGMQLNKFSVEHYNDLHSYIFLNKRLLLDLYTNTYILDSQFNFINKVKGVIYDDNNMEPLNWGNQSNRVIKLKDDKSIFYYDYVNKIEYRE